MKRFATYLSVVSLGWLLPGLAHAQLAFSAAHGNYAGLDGASWNPGLLADNRLSFQLVLGGIDAFATNNAYRYAGNWAPHSSDVPLNLSQRYLSLRPGTDARLGGAGLNVRGPGLLLRLNARNTVALSSRVRVAVQANAVSPEFISNAMGGFDQRAEVRNQTLNLNLNALAEWNLSYGRVLLEGQRHFVKVGATVRRINGLATAYLQTRKLDYSVTPQTAASGDTTVRLQRLEGAFGYVNPDVFDDFDAATAGRWLKPGKAPGSGWGVDVGVVYELRPQPDGFRYLDKQGRSKVDHSRNKYRLRLAAAITDVGSVRYKQAVHYAAINAANVGVSEADIDGLDLDNFDARLNRILRTTRFPRSTGLRTKLPTALHLDADYHLAGKLYVNAAISQSLSGRYAVGMRAFSAASVTPRLETKWLELAPSLLLLNNYRSLAPGLSLRVGPLLLGSNDLSTLLWKRQRYGANAYVQLSLLNIGNARHKLKPKTATPRPAVAPAPPASPLQPATPAEAPATPAPPAAEPTPAATPEKPAAESPAPAAPAVVEPAAPPTPPAATEPAASAAPAPAASATPAQPAPAEPAAATPAVPPAAPAVPTPN